MTANNILIEASAGTGKTFSLATRFITLLASGAVRPDQIIALTFSRAATREIYAKLAQRLAVAASDDAGAAKESKLIGRTLSKGEFAAILSKVIECQHIGTISTIDSFILRMIRYFPLELGFQGNVEILGDYDANEAKRKACNAFMTSTQAQNEFAVAFRDLMNGEAGRSFGRLLDETIAKWREFILNNPDAAGWTAESMMAAAGIDQSELREVRSVTDLISYQIASDEERIAFEDFFLYYAKYNASSELSPKSGIGKKIATAIFDGELPAQMTFLKKNYSFRPELIRAMRDDIYNACLQYVVARFRSTAAKLKIVSMIDSRYEEATRSRGRLTFGDLPRVIASHSAIDIENLQFRFDERFDHWAIDEFQDTSRAQWKCLSNLVEEASSGDAGRTVTIVGDIKQAIYAWRGGDESIFTELAGRTAQFGTPKVLAESYRYGRNTVDLLNKVFSRENIEATFSPKRKVAIEKWLDANSWMEHKVPEGRSQQDYVCVIGAASGKTARENPETSVVGKTVSLVKGLWERRSKNGQSGKSIAVLVRSNTEGREIADLLRHEDVPSVFEGENTDAAHPVIALFLKLLHFGEHPGDTYDYAVICRSPLSLLFRGPDGGMRGKNEISAEISRSISHLGLVRTLRKYTGGCVEKGIKFDEYSESALDRLMQAASEYEARGEAENGVEGFLDYYNDVRTRDTSNPEIVTVITIHRSKGLGYDWVVVPVLETNQSFEKLSTLDMLFGNGWALQYVSEKGCSFFDRLMKSREAACDSALLANLHTYYVALSRNKEGLWIVTENKEPTDTVHFSNLLCRALGIQSGKEDVEKLYESPGSTDPSVIPATEVPVSQNKTAVPRLVFKKADGHVSRRTPSTSRIAPGMTRKASFLFDSGFGAAAERGTSLHEALSGIEWISPGASQPESISKEAIDLEKDSAFRKAVEKDDGVCGLWREKSFELLLDGEWFSGTFDRVVFYENNGEKSAVIYDYKTNAVRTGETVQEFESRMADEYKGQMAAYRNSLSALTAIPPSRISTVLLLASTLSAVRISF